MRDNKPMMQKNSEFTEKVIQLKRVSKKTKGGNTSSFTALVVIGDKKGQVGQGYGKARDVATAVNKGVQQAKRNLLKIKIKGTTIAHEIEEKFGSAHVLFKPAPKGSGIIAGGALRSVLELSGIKDISSKMLGSNNKGLNVKCAIKALSKLKG